MALEQLISRKKLTENVFYAFSIGLFCAVIGMILSLRIFPEYASIVMVTFTVFPLIGVLYSLIMREEKEYEVHPEFLWSNPVLKVLCFIFLGMMVAYTAGFVLMPQPLAQHVFHQQIASLYSLSGPTGAAVGSICNSDLIFSKNYNYCQAADLNSDGIPEAIYYLDMKPTSVGTGEGLLYNYTWYIFRVLFINNLQLLLLVFLLSLIFGAGSIFVLAWNASILGVFFGSAIGAFINRAVGASLYTSLPISAWTIWLHGIPEFLSFFLSAIAGGVLGIVLIKRRYTEKKFQNVIKQASYVFVLSITLLVVAACIETFVLQL